jgi:hypothetical protein
MVSRSTVQASMVSRPTAQGQTWMVSGQAAEAEKVASILEALASALVDLSQADLARLQAARR